MQATQESQPLLGPLWLLGPILPHPLPGWSEAPAPPLWLPLASRTFYNKIKPLCANVWASWWIVSTLRPRWETGPGGWGGGRSGCVASWPSSSGFHELPSERHLSRVLPSLHRGFGAGVKAGFLEEEEELGRRSRTANGDPGKVESPRSPSRAGAHSQGWVAGLASAPRPGRWAPVLSASLGHQARHWVRPPPGRWAGLHLSRRRGCRAAHLTQVSRPAPAVARAPGLGSR